jgi:uncharacterized protein (TIGR03435 family)
MSVRLLLAVICCASFALAQSAFEVTSVKPSPPDQPGMGMRMDPGRVILNNATLRYAILLAFRIEEYQLVGGPKWLDADHYEIEGKCADASSPKEKMAMVQALLADRFQLKYHRETREVAGYVLVPAKTGLKIKKSEATDDASSSSSGAHMVSGKNETTGELASQLAGVLHRPVIDETGSKDHFDFRLSWEQVGDDPAPSVFSLIQEQLGIRMEARRVPIELLIIDSAEKPAAN